MEEVNLKVSRYNPEEEGGSFYRSYEIPLEEGEFSELTVLDCLKRLKEDYDGSLTFRHSCGHGSCGSCAMLINGHNRLACETHLVDLIEEKGTEIEVSPLPGFPVIRDLVVDLEQFFAHDETIKPYLIDGKGKGSENETLQKPEELEIIQEATQCIMCGACTSACPTYWDNKKYYGPSAFVRAFRWHYDTREKDTEERMNILDDKTAGIWGCNKVFNCNEACPKGIDTVHAIESLKRKALGF